MDCGTSFKHFTVQILKLVHGSSKLIPLYSSVRCLKYPLAPDIMADSLVHEYSANISKQYVKAIYDTLHPYTSSLSVSLSYSKLLKHSIFKAARFPVLFH